MSVNIVSEERSLIDVAVAEVRARLPDTWSVELSDRDFDDGRGGRQRPDALFDVRAPNGTFATILVEAKRAFAPRDVERLLGGLARTLRALTYNVPVLVVAPWISPRTQDLLETEGLNYLDLTGNVLLRLENPATYVKSTGAGQNPEPTPPGTARVRGPKAARLVRLLADVRPPYRGRELANATGLTPGYVSRLLDALDSQALIERSKRGGVESVDVQGLLRWWTGSYDVFRTNRASTFLAANGVARALERLATLSGVAVTGSVAAGRVAPVAAPALLLMYCDDVPRTADVLDLLPADDGANVALLSPFDAVVWERTKTEAGITYAAPSQVVVDCLTGTGRMPAEGEALLAWMIANEPSWRSSSLEEPAAASGVS
jgi:hypothetical protein